MKARRADRRAGFTLLELLVALAVLGLLVIGLTQGVRAGLALRQAQVQRLGSTAELDAAMRRLRALLTRTPVVPNSSRLVDGGDSGATFRGEPDRVSFVGELPDGFGSARRAEIALQLRGGDLVLSWVPHRHERALQAAADRGQTALLHGVARLDLTYWNWPAKDQPGGWQARWEGPAAPGLIKLHLGFPEGDARRWPDLVVAPEP